MYNSARMLLDNVLTVYNNIQDEVCIKDCKQKSEFEMWKELCFCILSSNVPFELAFSAFTHLSIDRSKNIFVVDITKPNNSILENDKVLYIDGGVVNMNYEYIIENVL